MAGNHVILECGSVWVVLGHLRRGSVAVQVGDFIEPGAVVGAVGNSGNTGEPHLHVHAQRPGTSAAPLGGDPCRSFRWALIVRNERVRANPNGS